MKLISNPARNEWENIFKRPAVTSADENAVAAILNDVRISGDIALRDFALKFDGVVIENLRVEQAEIISSEEKLSADLREAIRTAKSNIEKFHRAQLKPEAVVETMPGVRCWRKSVGIENVGLYIPGGSAPLFSTVLMLAIPATLAGCKRIVLCTPPGKDGSVNPAILFAAKECGVSEIYRVGGAQAIAAMRYGTETIPAVAKIFGPGNSWVTMAKQLIAKDGFPIDMPAGPSELAVFADDTVNPAFVAADLLSQAEHGPDSQVVLVSTKEEILERVIAEVNEQLQRLPRKEIALRALQNGLAILVRSETEGLELLNAYAPEHLILVCANAEARAAQVVNAGSVFIGEWSPESAGDYASGTNHTLPTNGNAMGWSGVSVDSFVKKITFQQLSREGLKNIGSTVQLMAEAEGLQAHANAITVRLK